MLLHADIPELVETWHGREAVDRNGDHENSPEREADEFGRSALSARRDKNPASRCVLSFDPSICPKAFPIATRKNAHRLKFEIQTLFRTLGSPDDRDPTGAWDECRESVIAEFFKSSEQWNPFLGTLALHRNLLLKIPSISSTETRLRPEDARLPIADVGDEIGVIETVHDEFRSERRRKDRILEEGVAIEVAMAGGGRFDVLPVVDENEELGVATSRTEMFHDLDSGAPRLDREIPHVVMLSDEASRCFVGDVINHAGYELAGLAVVHEREVAGHDGDRASGLEETGHDGRDDGVGRVKEHENLESVGKLVGEKQCSSPDKVL